MVSLGISQKPIVMPHYPHMLTEDIGVWSKFLKGWGYKLKEVWYDVHVGSPISTAEGPGTMVGRVAAGVSRKRIDCVARVGGGYWVVEVKPYASMLALGQALSYSRLFVSQYNPDGETIPVIVCDDYDKDLLDDFELSGVMVIQND